MARYNNEFTTSRSIDEVKNFVNSFMVREGFKSVNFKGEIVWKKGQGLLVAPQFIKTVISEKKVRLEAWIKYALLPGVYIGEMGLTGAMGFAMKRVLRKRVEELERMLK